MTSPPKRIFSTPYEAWPCRDTEKGDLLAENISDVFGQHNNDHIHEVEQHLFVYIKAKERLTLFRVKGINRLTKKHQVKTSSLPKC